MCVLRLIMARAEHNPLRRLWLWASEQCPRELCIYLCRAEDATLSLNECLRGRSITVLSIQYATKLDFETTFRF